MKTPWQGKGKENKGKAAPWCGSEFLRQSPIEKGQRGAADPAAADKGISNPLPNGLCPQTLSYPSDCAAAGLG